MAYSWDTTSLGDTQPDMFPSFDDPTFGSTPPASPQPSSYQPPNGGAPGLPRPGYHYEMNPTTGEWVEVKDGEQPPWGAITGPGYTPPAPAASGPPNPYGDGYHDPNGGSPPAVPLQPGMQWNWNGTVWSQVPAGASSGGGGGGTGGSGGGGGGAAGGGRSQALIAQLTADGHNVQQNGINGLIIDGQKFTLPAAPPQPTWKPTMFTPGQLPYQPTAIPTNDLNRFSYENVMGQLSTPASQANDALMRSLLEHPESMDPHTVEMLKAKSADELAAIGMAQDADLKRFGWSTGNQDSNWLASERAGAQRQRDMTLVGKNRDIEIEAARQNFQDRQAVAALGTAYIGEQRQREALANDVGLRSSALRGDRLQFNEQMKAEAAKIGISADELLQNFVISQMEDLTKRWGIQVQGELDIARLSTQSSQFQQDLAFRLAQLQQQAELAYAGYGLDAARIQVDAARGN